MSRQARRVRIDLAYDGTGFAGWQVQPGACTVQGLLEHALSRLAGGRRVGVRGAGRTDAGVHALQQVADAELPGAEEDSRIHQALAAMLPAEVRPWSVRTVAADFDSRRRALSKSYQYLLDRSVCGDPFLARFAWHRPRELDGDAMRRAIEQLPGERDWAGFAGAATQVRSSVRRLSRASFVERGGLAAFTFTAEGFLNRMVRNLVGTLLEIGRGRFPPHRVDEILRTRDRGLGGPAAAPQGLCLVQVRYDLAEPEVGDDPWIERGCLPWRARSETVASAPGEHSSARGES